MKKQRVLLPQARLRECFLAVSLGLVSCALWPMAALAQTFTSAGTITISNGVAASAPYPSLIYIGTNGAASLPGTIQKLTITLRNLNCPAPDDLGFMLVAPTGTAYEFMSSAGGGNPFIGNLMFDDNAASLLPQTGVSVGTYKPTSYNDGADTYPLPAPTKFSAAEPNGSTTLADEFNGLNPNGTWQLFLFNRLLGPAGTLGSWSLNFTINPPDLSITASGIGSFCRGQAAQYLLVVHNGGPGSTGGNVAATVIETLPAGLTPSVASGSGWNCVISNQTVTCTQTNPTAAGTSYSPITLTVGVATNAAASLINTATVSGSGDNTTGNDTASVTVSTLVDTVPPTITCSSNITVTAFGSCPVAVNFNVSASDNCTLSSLVATPASGSAFPVGTNTVTVVATDGAGNTNFCTFNVTVLPGPAPRLAALLAGTNVILSWAAAAGCYELQSTPTLLSPSSSNLWTTYAGQRATNAGSIVVTNSVPAASRFYRLAY